ncbi:swarming motility protein YbiA [Mycena crocata]|nr:swarming motility protein YbiA [Mycena crocata]
MNIAFWHKFTQHEALKQELLGTGDAELIENSAKDAFWCTSKDGQERNELGKALERLRTTLQTPF